MTNPKIAIIGAGPGGLTLARLLQNASIPCKIYEGESSPTIRNQGGTIDLHPRAGQRALLEAGLLDEFKKFARPEGQATKIIGFDGRVMWDDNADFENAGEGEGEGEDERPEIDREDLRRLLLGSVDKETIVWGKRLLRVNDDISSKGKGKHDLVFSDGSVESGIDLVVGADGAWSRVREKLTDVKPFYSGITALEIWATEVEEKYEWLSGWVGKGSAFMFDEGRAVIAQRNGREGKEGVRVYAAVRVPEGWVEEGGVEWSDKEGAKRKVVEKFFGDCGEDVKRAVMEGKDELVVRKLWMLPVGVKWESVSGLTLLGDAAHLMTPFAGVGVNVAMADALELARALISKKDSFLAKAFSDSHNISLAVKEYETSMFERGKQNAEKTMHGLESHFSSKGGEERVARLKKHHEMRKAAALGKK